jgi:hypothetical protein
MSNKPKIIVGCECSGVVRAAFANIGWDAVSVDLEPDDGQGRILESPEQWPNNGA